MALLGMTWETSGDFTRWIDAVFEQVRRELGGDVDQIGDVRHYADGEFCFAGDAANGDVAFSVDHPRTRASRTQSFILEWRSYQPARVAEKLIDAYCILSRSATR